jgi:thioesterase domain-containing protein
LLRHTGRRLPIAVFFTAPTIAAMAAWLDAAPDAPVSRALVTLQPKGDAPALFCVHGYGGDAYVYLPLAKDLAPDRPVHGIQAIGLDGRRPRHSSVEQMAAHYADEIVACQPSGPYHLLGFSAGGWMAYAVAQELRARGAKIGLLAVLDTHANARLPLWLHVWESINQGCKRAVSRWHERDAFVARLRALPYGQLAPYIVGRFRHLFGRRIKVLPPVSADDLAPPPLRRALRDPDKSPEYYFVAVTRYSARPYAGDLVIFSSQPEGYFRWSFWPHLVRGRVTIEPAQGAHIDLLEPENTPSLAASLRRLLANADRD